MFTKKPEPGESVTKLIEGVGDAKAPVHVLVIPTRHVPAAREATGAEGEARQANSALATQAFRDGEAATDGVGVMNA